MKEVSLLNLGTIQYGKAFDIQKELWQYAYDNDLPGFFLFVEHPPVFTIGRGGSYENLLFDLEYIKRLGIEVYETDRGGDVTYHGPGQIVGYPIINLGHFKKKVRWYVHLLEETIIRSLEKINIPSTRKEGYIGIWVDDTKICAIGVRIKKWVTMHGFALNHHTNLNHFGLINPCGITEFGVTSVEEWHHSIGYKDMIKNLETNFAQIFGIKFVETSLGEVRKQYEHS